MRMHYVRQSHAHVIQMNGKKNLPMANHFGVEGFTCIRRQAKENYPLPAC